MSYYYDYYLGYQTEDGKIYPLGPFNNKGKLKPVISESRSFASDLHDGFWHIDKDQISDELINTFKELYNPELDEVELLKVVGEIKTLPYDDLPNGDFIETGYFLIDDIADYEKYHFEDDIFCDWLTPTEYAARLSNELKFGEPKKKYDIEGEDITPKSVSEYAFYAYPKYYKNEKYDAFLLRTVAEMLGGIPNKAKLVVLETEG